MTPIAPIGSSTLATQPVANPGGAKQSEEARKASQQFESILLRQFLAESMKSLLENGPSGQVYGYMLTDSLADSISKGGGLGLCSVIQAQLGNEEKNVKP